MLHALAMKIALVHDYLNQLGGGERVLDELIKMFPEAKIYTLLYDKEKTRNLYEGKIARTSFLDFKFVRDFHRIFIPFMPFATLGIRIPNDVDLIISTSAGFGKGIRYNRAKTKHLCYVHTPLRYAWETSTYFGHSLKTRLFNFIFWPAFWFVRRFDYWAGRKPDILLANSQYIADKIKEYYGRDSVVVYPPVCDFWFLSGPNLPLQKGVPALAGEGFYSQDKSQTVSLPALGGRSLPAGRQALPLGKGEYFLAVGRLLHYKRFDLIITACAKAGVALKIAGTGPELSSLKAKSSNLQASVDFLGYISEQQLRELYAGATAFIMANEEDFGLVMAEAQACGAPVIAYGKGGAREIVREVELGIRNKELGNGVFFEEQTVESLANAIKKIQGMEFDRKEISESAKRFSVENFRKGIMEAVSQLVS
jgi:glycosyltransferase involved in cell wall biosynthesis